MYIVVRVFMISLLAVAGCLNREIAQPTATLSEGNSRQHRTLPSPNKSGQEFQEKLLKSQESNKPGMLGKQEHLDQTEKPKPENPDLERYKLKKGVLTIIGKNISIQQIVNLAGNEIFNKRPAFNKQITQDLRNSKVEGWLVINKISHEDFITFIEKTWNLKYVVKNEGITVEKYDSTKPITKKHKGMTKPPKEIIHPRFKIKTDEKKNIEEYYDIIMDFIVKDHILFKHKPFSEVCGNSAYDFLRFYFALYGISVKFEESNPNWNFWGFWPPDKFELIGLPEVITEGKRFMVSPPDSWHDCYDAEEKSVGGSMGNPSLGTFSKEPSYPYKKLNVKDVIKILDKPLSEKVKMPENSIDKKK